MHIAGRHTHVAFTEPYSGQGPGLWPCRLLSAGPAPSLGTALAMCACRLFDRHPQLPAAAAPPGRSARAPGTQLSAWHRIRTQARLVRLRNQVMVWSWVAPLHHWRFSHQPPRRWRVCVTSPAFPGAALWKQAARAAVKGPPPPQIAGLPAASTAKGP